MSKLIYNEDEYNYLEDEYLESDYFPSDYFQNYNWRGQNYFSRRYFPTHTELAPVPIEEPTTRQPGYATPFYKPILSIFGLDGEDEKEVLDMLTVIADTDDLYRQANQKNIPHVALEKYTDKLKQIQEAKQEAKEIEIINMINNISKQPIMEDEEEVVAMIINMAMYAGFVRK